MGLIAELDDFSRTLIGGVSGSISKSDPGSGELLSAVHFSAPGDDSVPLSGDPVALIETQQTGSVAAVGYGDLLDSRKSQPGEKRIYARSAVGAQVAEVWLQNSGAISMTNNFGGVYVSAAGTVSMINPLGGIVVSPNGDVTINGTVFQASGNVFAPGFLVAPYVQTSGGIDLGTHIHPHGDPNTGTPIGGTGPVPTPPPSGGGGGGSPAGNVGDIQYKGPSGDFAASSSLNFNGSTLAVIGAITSTSLDTGQGPNQLYGMDQDVTTADAVTFATVDTGQGANELYPMDQAVLTTSSVTFNSVDTGQGANELYAMDQDVTTTSDVTFADVTVNGALLQTGTSNEVQATFIGHSTQTANILEIQDSSMVNLVEVTGTGQIGMNTAPNNTYLHMFVDSTVNGIWIEETFPSFSGIPFRYGTSSNNLFEIDKNANVTIKASPSSNSKSIGLHIDQSNWIISSGGAEDYALMKVNAVATGTAAKPFAGFEGAVTLTGTAPSGKPGHGTLFAFHANSGGSNGGLTGGKFEIQHSGSGTINNFFGGWYRFDGGGNGTISNLRLANHGSSIVDTPVTTGTSAYYEAWTNTTGVVGTLSHIYLEKQTIGTTNWQIYSEGGRHYFGGQTQIVGDLNEVQLVVTGHASQSINLANFTDSIGAQQMGIALDGAIQMGGVDVIKITDTQTGATDNIHIGPDFSAISGARNVVIGHDSVSQGASTILNCVAIGGRAMKNAIAGNSNFALGTDSLLSMTNASKNVGIGTSALKSLLTTDDNVAVGESSFDTITISSKNTGIGSEVGKGRSGGSNNTFAGYKSGEVSDNGSNNTFIGYRTGRNGASSLSNCVYLGYDVGNTATGIRSDRTLAIDCENTSWPLLHGYMDQSGNPWLTINGYLTVDGRANTVQQTIIGHSTQTSNLTEWQDATLITNASMSVDGDLTCRRLSINGLFQNAAHRTETTTPQTITDDDFLVKLDCTSADIVVNLPAASSSEGKMFCVQKIDGSANKVKVTPNGTDDINGANVSWDWAGQWQSYTFYSDGTEWTTIL